MCIVSDKIKFCTCVTGSYEDLPHYWLLYRFNKQKDLQCMGMASLLMELRQENYILNAQTLGNRLNEDDAFDKAIDFKPNDQLEIVINNLSEDECEQMTFYFRFKKGKWVDEEHDVFELMNRYDEFAFGNFENLEK